MEILSRAGRPACFHSGTISRGILAVIAAAGLILPAVSADAADSIVGKWVGTLYQQPAASSSSYPGEFVLTSPTSGTSRYPSLNCGGNLSGDESGGVYRFRESIVQGRATATTGGCIDGNIEMIVSGNTMTLRWSGSWNGQSYLVTGTLRRIDEIRASWSPGHWKPIGSQEVILPPGGCYTTWTCQAGSPDAPIMRSNDSQVLTTKSQRTKGTCGMTDNPKECGVCLGANEPMERCMYCVQPPGCSDPNLGTRTREAMGCCPAR